VTEFWDESNVRLSMLMDGELEEMGVNTESMRGRCIAKAVGMSLPARNGGAWFLLLRCATIWLSGSRSH
jgi:hypothetical protein